MRKLKYVRRGKQVGRNQMRVCLYLQDGSSWKMWTDDDKNPDVAELRRTLVSAIETLDMFKERLA